MSLDALGPQIIFGPLKPPIYETEVGLIHGCFTCLFLEAMIQSKKLC